MQNEIHYKQECLYGTDNCLKYTEKLHTEHFKISHETVKIVLCKLLCILHFICYPESILLLGRETKTGY